MINTGHCVPAVAWCDLLWASAQTQTVGSRQWKSDLRLNGKGKEGSRELATALFPASASLLRCALCLLTGRRF